MKVIIYYNNTTEIQSELHSVDSHGVNNVNFLILHVFNFTFAPRFKHISSKTFKKY